jgi:prepilin-type N-terminal cleavage/methylation domain-containing protein
MRQPAELRGWGEDGFTLVELIVAILILGVITVPLGTIVVGYLHNTGTTTARLLESHDVQIASAYWAQDVASIGTRSTTSPYPLTQSVETNVPYSSSLYPCGTTGTTPIVTLAWDDFTGAVPATLVRVAYLVQTVSGETQLHRLRCNGSAVVVSDVIVAHNLDPSTPPTVACSGTTGVLCTAAPAVPQTVTLTLALKDPNITDSAYVVPLTGQRRQS